jgi:hypothetical protein
MKRQDKPVIVEVKRAGRKPLVKATRPEPNMAAPEPVREVQSDARRAADLLFTPRAPVAVAPDMSAMESGDRTSSTRRVLPSLVEPVAAPAEPEPAMEEQPRRRGPKPGSRRVKPAVDEPVERIDIAPDAEIASRALDTLSRLESRSAVRASAGSQTDLVEQRRSAATPLVSEPKRRGRPPKIRTDVVTAEPDGDRVWTSSKIFDEGEDAPAVPAPVAPVVRPLRPMALVATTAQHGHLSYRSRVSAFKPGERWKRRLRGHAR